MSSRYTRVFLALCLVVFLAALSGCEQKKESATPKGPAVAVVNQEIVYRESQAAKAAVAHLDAVSDSLRNDIATLQATTQKNKNADKGKADFEAGLAEMQQRFAAEQQQVTVKVTELFEKSLETCRTQEGAVLVVSSDLVLAYDQTVDLTQKVLAEMDKTPIIFSRLGEEPAPAPGTTNATLPSTNATLPAAANSTAPSN